MNKPNERAPLMERFANEFDRGVSILAIWLFGDFAYAVLPLIVMALIEFALDLNFDHFLLIKEWSFATIVLCGVGLRKGIHLKVEVQKVPRSWTLDVVVQGFLILLISAVLILALVILAEKGQFPQLAGTHNFAPLQIVFFIAATALLLAVISADRSMVYAEEALPSYIGREWIYNRIRAKLDVANETLTWVSYALDRAADADESSGSSSKTEDSAKAAAAAALDQIRQLISDVSPKLRLPTKGAG